MRKASNTRGHALIEVIIVAPIILSIASLGLEVSRFLKLNQTASILSQEAANTAFRRCADIFVFDTNDIFSSTKTSAAIQSCLDTLVANVGSSATSLYPLNTDKKNPAFRLILSIYRLDSGASDPGIGGFPQLTRVLARSDNSLTSRYSVSGNSVARDGATVLDSQRVSSQERIAIAEVTFEYNPAILIYRVFLGLNILNTDEFCRETTIL
jgi:hypothetical protein